MNITDDYVISLFNDEQSIKLFSSPLSDKLLQLRNMSLNTSFYDLLVEVKDMLLVDRRLIIAYHLNVYFAPSVIKYDYYFEGTQVLKLEGHTRNISTIDVLPDGRIISTSVDSTIRIWDSDGVGTIFTKYQMWPHGLKVLPDGNIALLGDKGLRIWNLNTKAVKEFIDDQLLFFMMLFIPPNKIAAGTDSEGTINVWDIDEEEPLKLKGHTKVVSALQLFDNKRFISGSYDTTIKIWNVLTGQNEMTLRGHSKSITALAVLPNRKIVSGSQDTNLIIWDFTHGTIETILKGHTDRIRSIIILNSTQILSTSDDDTFRIWNVYTGKCDYVSHVYQGMLSVLPNGDIIIASHKSFLIFNLTTQQFTRIVPQYSMEPFSYIKIVSDGRVVTTSGDGSMIIWK